MQATAGTWAPEKGKRNHYDGHIGHMDSTELFTKNVPTTNPSVCLPPETTHMTERNGTDGTSTGTERNGAERNGTERGSSRRAERNGTERNAEWNGIRNGILNIVRTHEVAK